VSVAVCSDTTDRRVRDIYVVKVLHYKESAFYLNTDGTIDIYNGGMFSCSCARWAIHDIYADGDNLMIELCDGTFKRTRRIRFYDLIKLCSGEKSQIDLSSVL